MKIHLSIGPRHLLLALTIFSLMGCAGTGAIPIPTEKHVDFAARNGQATSLEALTLGRQLYLQRCSECHHLKRPAFLPHHEWPEMVRKMAKEAKINPDQQLVITQYLVAASAAIEDSLARNKNLP